MAKTLLLVGDIHGDWRVLNDVLQKTKKLNALIIQIGDFGLGFGNYTYLNQNTGLWEIYRGNNDPKKLPKRFQFISGNHDNPQVCPQYPNYMGNYGVDKKTGAFFLSGAWSIDRANRTEGIDWWADEELSYQELQKAIELYEKTKPDLVISHTCPSSIGKMLINPYSGGYHGSRTENALETMWKIHKPKRWFFGHWHRKFDRKILGTRFVCLDINEAKVLEI